MAEAQYSKGQTNVDVKPQDWVFLSRPLQTSDFCLNPISRGWGPWLLSCSGLILCGGERLLLVEVWRLVHTEWGMLPGVVRVS
jgi:hypothetical protein